MYFNRFEITVDVVLVGFVVGHVPNDDVRVETRANAVVAVGAHDKREHWTGVFSKRVDGLNIRVGIPIKQNSKKK